MKKLALIAIVSLGFIGCANSPREAWMNQALEMSAKGNTKPIDCLDRYYENDQFLHKCPLTAFALN